jgi:ssDNA-binding Zn-finger/Zn-ribbon topoisomerase 1
MTAATFILTGTCPHCHSTLLVRHTRSTHEPFVGCKGYPACRFTAQYDEALAAVVAEYQDSHEALLEALRRTHRQLAEARQELEQWQSTATTIPSLAPHDLRKLLVVAHPDRWCQGQLATELAHELTVSINALRERLGGTL